MRIRRFLRRGLVVPVAAALALGSAEAQVRSSLTGPGTGSFEVPWSGATPVAFEGYYSHYRLDADGEGRSGMNGVGARLMWRPASGDSLAMPRFGLGLFGEYAPGGDLRFSLVHAGIQGDVMLVSQPWFRRLTPVASLGAGVLRTSVDDGAGTTSHRVHLGRESATSFALTPAAGVKLAVWRGLGIRVDARDLVTFRGGPWHNWQLTTGVTFPF